MLAQLGDSGSRGAVKWKIFLQAEGWQRWTRVGGVEEEVGVEEER